MPIVDTLSASEDLKAAGFTEDQARAMIRVYTHIEDQVATKKDLDNLYERLSFKMDLLRREMDILKRDIRLSVYATGIAIASLMAALELL